MTTPARAFAEIAIAVPPRFALGHALITNDAHAAGQLAARRALAQITPGEPPQLAYDGTRPVIAGAELAISISHGRTRAVAVVAPVARIGIDLVDDLERVARIADRYLAAERSFASSPRELATCFAAKEAGLKALGLGLLDGGMFDDCAVHVLSLDPPRLDPPLTLVIGTVPEGVLAIAYD